MLLLVLAAELTVRLALPAGKVPRGAYHSSEFRQQVEQYREAIPVDMLITGSSVAAVNYPPVPLDERLHELGKTGFTTYNAGIRGCNYECIAVGVRRHYLPEFQPPIVLLVLSPADLNIDNDGVVARSRRFVSDMERGPITRAGRQMLAGVSYLYGFKEEIRDWLTSGKWTFDPAVLGERGYIDMGSEERGRNKAVPHITEDSELTLALISLVEQLSSMGTKVILLPVEGDSIARSLFNEDARLALRKLMNSLTKHANVHELTIDTSDIPDGDYIDTSHLSSGKAVLNAQRLAEHLFESGLLN